jgi:hypothetical protein
MAQVFHYKKHLTSGDEIRLLKILPGHGDQPIRAKICYRHLTENRRWHRRLFNQPPYKALSYTWGNPFDDDYAPEPWRMYESLSDRPVIDLDGFPFTVTIGLSLALQKIRKRHGNVLLWVDAICIDQAHNEEKSWQIQKMRDIYQSASRVLVWLGPSSETSDVAMDTLTSGYRHMKRTFERKELGPYKLCFTLRAAKGQASTDQLLATSLEQLFGLEDGPDGLNPGSPIDAIGDLFHRAYWGRAWCWQEFAVATKMTIICGDKILKEGDMCVQIFLATWDRLTMEVGRQPTILDHRPWAMMECRSGLQNIRYLKERGFEDDSSTTLLNLSRMARNSSYMHVSSSTLVPSSYQEF